MKKFKKILTGLSSFCLSFSIVSCDDVTSSSSSSMDSSNNQVVEEIESLKVLCIGNSFSADTIEHVPNIALNSNVKNVKFGNLYIGGCSLNKHYNNAINNIASYEYFVNEGKGWSSSYNHSILSVIKSEEWDYISIQHGTGDGSRYADINSYLKLESLIGFIKANASGNPKIAFNMTWVGEKGSHEELINVFNNDTQAYYESICNLTKNTISKSMYLDLISPTGTAIQNARTASLGSLNRDGYHLSYTTGRYAAGLTFFMAITGKDISNIKWAPSGMSQYMIDVAIESAVNAIKNPYGVTNSIIEVPEFQWPVDASYGQAATPSNPYYPHCAKNAPEVESKVDLFPYFNISKSLPIVSSTLQSSNNLGLTIDLTKTPYLYFSFVIPEGSDFTFSIYSNSTYAPWLTFLDRTQGNAKLGQSAETWDALFANNRAQYATNTQTGCIDLRDYAKDNATKWIITMMKLYSPKGAGVTLSYFFIGSEPK